MHIKRIITLSTLTALSMLLLACNVGANSSNIDGTFFSVVAGVSPSDCSESQTVTFAATTVPAVSGTNMTFQFFNSSGIPYTSPVLNGSNCTTNAQGTCSVSYACNTFTVGRGSSVAISSNSSWFLTSTGAYFSRAN